MAKKQSITKNCPPIQFFFVPTLKALDELGGSGSNEEIYNRVLIMTKLPTKVIDIMHNFTMTEVEYRLFWARTYLKNYGAIENSKHKVWALTTKGAKMLKNDNIDPKDIYNFTTKKRGKKDISSEEDVVETESVNWREQITDILQHLNPYAFERLAQRLLRECGFSDVQVTKRSGDGGIDGTGKLRIQGIFSFNVAFQCKRYKGQVGAATIRDFRGSLGTNIEKGVLITTGAFTKAAKEEASSEGKRLIDLMDGEELINKLAEYGIGLNEVKSYEVDEDFFNSLIEQ
ncbi:MAG: Mrr restriction system protein [Bacteroidaceae bacterium]|nr:Mrr restriction system protein [Bacteroidaceae bacterium]MDO5481973.1 Mrr restriction system protein [Bacteroidaceae bacterium]